MLKIISIIALTFGLTFSAFAVTDIPVNQFITTAQTDVSADDETTEEYIDWTFE